MLGLIGGGMAPQSCMHLIETYGRNRPLDEIVPLALAILDARWSGKPDPEPTAPAATGHLAAAISTAQSASPR